jgi:PAS domain S-box-containing protein
MQDKIHADKLSERLRTAQRIAKMGFWDWNIQTNSLYWSEEIFNIFGLDAKLFEATYDAFLNSVHPGDRQQLEEAVAAAINNKADYKVEHRIIRPDGEILHVSEQGFVSYNDKGEPKRLIGTVIDITELKESELSRIQVEEEFRNLWERSFHSMITIDSGSRITRVNKSTEARFGYSREELIGQNINLLVPEKFRSAHSFLQEQYHQDPSARVMGAGLELEAQCKNGEVIPVEVALSSIEHEGHREVLVQIQDISDRKNLENKLHQAKKLEALGRSVGGLAHDLNNLLAVMYNSIEMANLRLNPNGSKDSDIERALKAGDRARNMIDQMLAFTRQNNLQPKLIDVNEIIQKFEKLIRPLIPEQIQLDLVLGSQLGRARLDPEKFEQIIMNLVLNARDAIDGSGKITIRTSALSTGNPDSTIDGNTHLIRYIQISIIDTGSGMSKEEIGKIFEPFFTTKQSGQGTGLGLASVYGIVKQSRGDITVDSTPGIGSRFDLCFPVAETQ